jgi:predicted HTH transcriptional regulator
MNLHRTEKTKIKILRIKSYQNCKMKAENRQDLANRQKKILNKNKLLSILFGFAASALLFTATNLNKFLTIYSCWSRAQQFDHIRLPINRGL